ncbi:zinc metalloprotease ZmpD [Streptococcus pneumoniae]|nr:zinc metalloprotease ZmpD [Streptococcus pneumoniae]
MSLLKKDKFSIRKIKGIVGSIFLGSFLFALSVVGVSTYHYLDYSTLTQTERDQLKQGRPDESKESYALVYEKDALPNTGSSQSIMTVLGLLAIGSLIVIITKDKKRKKIATFLIVGATGLVTLSTASALNLNANIHESGRDGVLQISGYRYVGYLELDDRTVSSVSPASTVSPVEQPKVVTDKGEPEVQPALPEAVVTGKGKTEVQPTLPEAVVTEKGEPEVQPVLPEAVVAEKGEPEVQPVLPEAVVTEKGEPEVQPALPEAVVTEKGEPEVHEKPDYTQPIGANLVESEVHEKLAYTEPVGTTGVDENGNLIEPPVNDIPEYTEPISTVSEVASEREELPSLHTDIRTETIPKTTIEESDPSKFIGDNSVKQVGEDGERQIVTSYEELHGKKISESVETVTILKEMKPEIIVKGTKERPKEKTAPVLTLTKVTEDAMNRSANLNYELDNKDNAEISSIVAEIKDGDTVVKRVDLSKEKLTDAVQNLDLFKDYKIATTMIYDRGQGSETSKLDERPLRLELKKVEIKNIASTNLVKVNDDGTETPSDFMNEKPSEEDVKKMYLKITSRDNKVTRLTVDSIEEVTEEGQKLYKITAEAQDLIQHTDPTKVRNKYVYYIEKPHPKEDNVYYNFKDLVDAMNTDKNGTFKLGADLNATGVPTPKKWYVDGDFRGTLKSVEGKHYTIHNTERPLFQNIIGGTVTKVNLGNVNINMPWADRIAPIADTIKGGAKIEDVKVTGNVLGRNWVSGFIDKIDNQGTLRNVAFIGNVTSVGDGGQFLTGIDKIMVHYADGTKEEMDVTKNADSKVKQVREYTIAGQNVVYTPNMVEKDRNQLIQDIKDKLASVQLISPEVRALMDARKKPEENTDERKNGYIKDLYLEESFAETKANLDKLVKSLVENADHQLNSDEAAMKALVKKVDENKAKIMMALTYLNRYYDIKYGDMTIKNLMMFKPDFYGKSVDLLDFLIRIGSSERNIKGDRTLDAYRDMIGGTIGKSELHGFLDYNMRLFTNDTDLNDWFIHAAKNVYVSEPQTTNPDFVNKRHRAFDGLNNGVHNRMILPLLTLKNAHMFLISTYNTMAYSSFEKYGKYTEEARNEFKKEIDKVAHAQQTYLDFWSRLALPSVRDQLLKSENRVPTPVWDNQNYSGIKGINRMGYDEKKVPIAPIRELYGPTWKFHNTNWNMGAMASIFPNPNNNDQVYFMGTNMISPFGISAFTHETTHVNDRMLYFGGHRHRQGTDVEAYAQGMLQTPSSIGHQGEYGALGLNMAYHRENDGDQWYNYDPDKLQTREDIDRYMKNYNEALMMLDHVEADAVLPQLNGDNSKWFKKIDREMRRNLGDGLNNLVAPHQWDNVRDLNQEESSKKLSSINDLIDNNFMTKHGNPGNGRYRPEDFRPNSAYVNVNMMAGIYGGNTSQGAPGSLSFKHNAFRMWGYYGYDKGLTSYVSSKYQGEADKQNQGRLGDDFIIKKVSNNQFSNLEDWKKYWYHDVKSRAEKGFTEITIDGQTIHNYNELKDLFDKAVTEDLKKAGNYSNTENLKSKVFKALLKNTDGFFNPLFKKDI